MLFVFRVLPGNAKFVSGIHQYPHALDDILKDRISEVEQRFSVKLFPVDDPHLLEECGLAALSSAQQQDLYQPPYGAPLARQIRVDLTTAPLRLALLVHVPLVDSIFPGTHVIVSGVSGQQTPAQGAHHASHPVQLQQGQLPPDLLIKVPNNFMFRIKSTWNMLSSSAYEF